MSTLPDSPTPLTDATEADLKKDGYSTEAFPLSAVLARSRRLERSRDEWRDVAERLAVELEGIRDSHAELHDNTTLTRLFDEPARAVIDAFNALRNKYP